MKIGFDNDKYLKMQSEHIRERIGQFGNKLYLEFGGKLFDDYHASRVLPGFEPDSKLRMLMQLSDQAEIVMLSVPMTLTRIKYVAILGSPMTKMYSVLWMSFQAVACMWEAYASHSTPARKVPISSKNVWRNWESVSTSFT